MKRLITLLVSLWILVFTSFFPGCGSAEAIKSYRYPTTKDNLEKAIMKVIKSSPTIYLDSTTNKRLDSMMLKDRDKWTPIDSANFYDNRNAYVRIKIKVGEQETDYVLRFRGDRHHWESSTSSAIFISEVRDKNGNGLSQGHNEKGQFSSKLAKEFTDLLETELITKVDKELNLKYIVD